MSSVHCCRKLRVLIYPPVPIFFGVVWYKEAILIGVIGLSLAPFNTFFNRGHMDYNCIFKVFLLQGRFYLVIPLSHAGVQLLKKDGTFRGENCMMR